MGYADAFPYRSPAEIFREHAALTGFENDGDRDLDLGGLAEVTADAYDDLAPVQWPVPRAHAPGRKRLFAEGGFFTDDRRARLVAPESPRLATPVSDAYPFILNTGRVRDQWHTMTRTGKSPRLGSHRPVPYVEIHPADALALGLSSGNLARVWSDTGSAVLEVEVTDAQRPGSLFVPIHWSGETSSDGSIGALVRGCVDAHSGAAREQGGAGRGRTGADALRGFILSRRPVRLPAGTWWARCAVEGGSGTLFAAPGSARDVAGWVAELFPGAELAEYVDAGAEVYRCAAFTGGAFEGALFVAPASARPQWDTVKDLLAQDGSDADRRLAVSGRGMQASGGPTICACFSVGLDAIRSAIASGGASSPEEIGAALRAGTNCGSCVPELRRILAAASAA
ncbi:(2Fe-2S)-binding protein [Micromonospora sp. STR1s_5]|nr:(2Fe-2S)-binding protein [Micromonospora sp. STR1s_5]